MATKIVDYSMKAILAWTGLLLVGASSDIALAEPTQYLCTVEHAGGLHYDKHKRALGVHGSLVQENTSCVA